MNKLKLFQVDAFTNKLFTGNPAGVCLLKNEWLTDIQMQNIAMENNLAETAFLLHSDNQWFIKWFTPTVEVDLCGHATLASAHVLFNHEMWDAPEICFSSRSGNLYVSKNGELLTLNFPTDFAKSYQFTNDPNLKGCFSKNPLEVYRGKSDYMLVFESEDDIVNMQFDLNQISKVDARGIIITAPGKSVDFVSRFFAPQSGISEDPVTGSAHTILTPFWSRKLNKTDLSAMQLSSRKGCLTCKLLGDRVAISGCAVTYLVGEIFIY